MKIYKLQWGNQMAILNQMLQLIHTLHALLYNYVIFSN